MQLQAGYLINLDNKISLITNLTVGYVLENETLNNIMERFANQRRSPVLTKGGNLVGVLTHTDLIKALLSGFTPQSKTSSFMSRNIVSCEHTHSVQDVLRTMRNSGVGGVPILSDKKLLGMVNEREFVNVLALNRSVLKVRDVMTKKPFYVNAHTSILDCAKSMINTKYRRFPVLENKQVVGIVTSYDIINHLRASNLDITTLNEPVSNIMSKPVLSLSQDDELITAVKLMKENSIGGIPVMDDGKLIGIFTENDLVKNTHLI